MMIFTVRGIRGIIAGLIALVIVIVFLVLLFNVIILLIPIILILAIIGYFFRVLGKFNKGKTRTKGRENKTYKKLSSDDVIDVSFKVKKE